MSKHYLSLRYKDRSDNIKDLVIPIPEDEYNESLSYRENLQIIASDMCSDGAFWVDENTIVPYHRVICIESHNNLETNENAEQKTVNTDNTDRRRKFFKRRHNRYNNNEQKVVENEKPKKPTDPNNSFVQPTSAPTI
jgi:uncharacterized protein (UPF0248 family)